MCAEAFDKGTGKSLWNLNRQDKSIGDEPLIQRVCGKAPPFSAVLLLFLKMHLTQAHINLSVHDFVPNLYISDPVFLKKNFLGCFEQATQADLLRKVNSTERFPKTLACDMMASSGALAIDTESSIISL